MRLLREGNSKGPWMTGVTTGMLESSGNTRHALELFLGRTAELHR